MGRQMLIVARRLELPMATNACAQSAFQLSCSLPAGMEGIGLMHRAVTYKRVTISMCTPGELRGAIRAMLRRGFPALVRARQMLQALKQSSKVRAGGLPGHGAPDPAAKPSPAQVCAA